MVPLHRDVQSYSVEDANFLVTPKREKRELRFTQVNHIARISREAF